VNALAFFGLFFLALAAVALHGWAANSQDADEGASPTSIPARTGRQLVPHRGARASRSPRPAALCHAHSADRHVVVGAPATPPGFAFGASEGTTTTR
jgi:hypothetical protein